MHTKFIHLRILALLVVGGCRFTELNPEHCANNEGDATCRELHGDARPYCEIGESACISAAVEERGCLAERPTDECYSPCGNGNTVAQDGSCLDEGESSSGSSSGDAESSTGEESGSTSEAMTGSTTTGPIPCVDHDECTEEAAPLCDPAVGECVACDSVADGNGDAACADLDSMMPLCVGAACVACTPMDTAVCDEQLLLCDDATNACTSCTEHAQCESGACELAVGMCFASDVVVHVDGDGGGARDFESVTDAVMNIDPGQRGVIVVHEQDGESPYTESVTIDGARTVALIGADGEAPIILGTGGNPGLSVTGGETTVYVERIGLVGNTSAEGLMVDGAMVDVRRSRIVQNSGGGIVAQGGATLTVENCFVGGDENDVDAVTVDGSTATILYSTIGAGFGAATALSCEGGYAVAVRNSILVARAVTPELDCSRATIDNTALELGLGGTNISLGEMEVGWFGVDGETFGSGDFHLAPTAPLALSTAAVWQEGDPTTDIDGDLRPATGGASDIAGADVP